MQADMQGIGVSSCRRDVKRVDSDVVKVTGFFTINSKRSGPWGIV